MGRIMHAMAVMGYRVPAGFSVASNYLSVLSELAAEHGAEFAITYDRELRRHIRHEAVPIASVAPYLRTVDDARAIALQRTFNDEKAEKEVAAARPAPAAGGRGGGGQGGKGAPRGDRGNNDRGRDRDRNCDRNRSRPNNHNQNDTHNREKRDVKVEDKLGAADDSRPWKKRR